MVDIIFLIHDTNVTRRQAKFLPIKIKVSKNKMNIKII